MKTPSRPGFHASRFHDRGQFWSLSGRDHENALECCCVHSHIYPSNPVNLAFAGHFHDREGFTTPPDIKLFAIMKLPDTTGIAASFGLYLAVSAPRTLMRPR
jgi:hypothetical protein